MIVTLKPLDRAPRNTGHAARHAAPPTRREPLAYAGLLAFMAILLPFRSLWAVQALLMPILLIVPGALLLRALRVPGEVVSAFPAYIPCASIVVLFGSGLAVDIVGPLAGVTAPLRALPLLVGLEIVCWALLASSVNAPPAVTIRWRPLCRPVRHGWPLLVPLVAAAGALRLNNGHGNGIALIAAGALVVLLVAATISAERLNEIVLKVILYATGLSISWSYSLRGDGVYGFDIATEYQRLQQTILTGVWHPAHPNDAYGAMLSVTIMPAGLHAMSGLSGLLVLKVVYPMIYALFPVAIFDLAHRILSRRWAFVAAAFTIGQYAFTEIASLARQEIALLLFVAFIAAILDTQMGRRPRWTLAALLGLAMALSHYSTTYVAITLVGFMLPLQWAASWLREIPRLTGAAAVAFAVVFAGAAIWYIPVTHSNSHLVQVAQTVQAQGFNFLPNRVPGGSFLSAYLQGNAVTPIPAKQYQDSIAQFYSFQKPYITPFPGAKSSQYSLRDSAVPQPPVKWYAAHAALGLGLLIIEQLANLLAALGALLMVLRRNASVVTRQIGLLALVATLLLTLIRFSGTLASVYGQERAQLQGLVLLALALGWAIQGLASARKLRYMQVPALAGAGLAVVMVNTSYLANAILGGGTSANLSNSGSAFEFFYTSAPELASARWLGQAAGPGQLVYADEYGQLPLAAETGLQNGLVLDVTPRTLNQHAWVYASRANVIDGRSFAVFDNHLASYVFPAAFLDTNYNVVYTDGSSEVFHR